MDGLGENVKKLLLAGIGTVAVTAEKSIDLLEEMVKKGELTVEQGKALNEELKHDIKEKVKKSAAPSEPASDEEDFDEFLGKMSPEQIEKLKEKLSKMENKEDVQEASAE